MINFETYLTHAILDFLRENQKALLDRDEINHIFKKTCGINAFFNSQEESSQILKEVKNYSALVTKPDRREYGDFQTNNELAAQVVGDAFERRNDFEFVLEPTCGKGNFILAVLKQSNTLKKIVGVEIYQPYVWETKFKILDYFLNNPRLNKPNIDLIHANAFEFDYAQLAQSTKHLKTLVIGNPPWVTNSELSSIHSKNLPQKSNFKKHKGFEAMTGKGNFDIGEYISLVMLRSFEHHNGIFAFLIKNSVVKNLIHDQKRNNFKIGQAEKQNIDAKKEFNVSVHASLFLTRLNTDPEYTCQEIQFDSKKKLTNFGWHKEKFVYSITDYDKSGDIDGKSIFTWRSGVKHDCSKVMEFEQKNGHYVNGLGEEMKLENNLVFGLLKSSDLKTDKTNNYRKLTIITQKKIGQETDYIKGSLPLTYQYLQAHKHFFDKRKSSIYKGKPDFSIFGIGDYSFAKYKVAISGLYKSTHFTLVHPKNSKTIMLDDTCYFIGFDKLKMAQIAHYLLNSELVQKFLKSIIFSDAKRSINKDTLMRIDFQKAFQNIDLDELKGKIPTVKEKHLSEFQSIIHTDEEMMSIK